MAQTCLSPHGFKVGAHLGISAGVLGSHPLYVWGHITLGSCGHMLSVSQGYISCPVVSLVLMHMDAAGAGAAADL